MVEIDVTDHGIGIAPEERNRVFDRFYRTPLHDGIKGSGLSLCFCRCIVEEHASRAVDRRCDPRRDWHDCPRCAAANACG